MAAGFSSLLAALALAAAAGSDGAGLRADDIPVAHTPKVPGGYGRTFPEPVLRRCTEPLAAGAPDLRGIWRLVEIDGRAPAPPTLSLSTRRASPAPNAAFNGDFFFLAETHVHSPPCDMPCAGVNVCECVRE